jgi:methionyl aminopeptidase
MPSLGPTFLDEASRIAPLVSRILGDLGRSVQVGVTTKALEAHALDLLRDERLESRMLGYRGFPAAIAVSVDDEVVHGLPSSRVLEDGQLVKIQIGGRTGDGFADQGWTFACGKVDALKQLLHDVGIEALRDGLATIRALARIGDMGAAIQTRLESAGLAPIRDFVGYGMGPQGIQPPQLKGYGKRGTGDRFVEDALLHVQVIAAAGDWAVSVNPNKWTAITKDGSPAALFTTVVRVRAEGCDVLTPLLQ